MFCHHIQIEYVKHRSNQRTFYNLAILLLIQIDYAIFVDNAT